MTMKPLDPRLHAYRGDLAAEALSGRVEAARFVAGEPAQVCRGLADLRHRPAADAPLDTQLLFGEAVTRYDTADGWAWVQSREDGYVGYVEAAALSASFAVPDHRVAVLRSFLYPEPDLKTPPLDCLSMASPVEVIGTQGAFSEVRGSAEETAWIYSRHLAALDEVVPDYTATALEFLGAPYLWGGRGSLGLDCSALVQLALARAGIACQRDSDMQAETLGDALPYEAGRYRPAYGDLIYFPGHVAIALDETQVVHANAHHMLVVIEPLTDLLARVEAESGREAGKGIDAVRRPPEGR